MDEPRSDIFRKLENAVEQWSAQVSEAQGGLAEQLARAKDRLDEAGSGLGGVGRLPALIEEFRDELRAVLEEIRSTRKPDGASEAAPAFPEAFSDLRQGLDALRRDVGGLQRDVAGMRGDLATVPRLVQRLDDLRRLAVKEPASTDEASDSAKRLPADAWQEVARLRAQLEEDLGQPAVPPEDVDPAELERQAYDDAGRRRRMGEILVASGVLKPHQLELALGEQERLPSRRLGSILLEEGFAPEEIIARVLAGQLRTRFVRLTEEDLDEQVAALISARMARHHTCLPLRATEDRLILAMANPFDLIAIDDVELATHRRVEAVVATSSDLDAAITRVYGS